MKVNLILPVADDSKLYDLDKTDSELTTLVTNWINERSEHIHSVWSVPSGLQKSNQSLSPSKIAEEATKILIHRVFNYQSKKKLGQTVSQIQQNLFRQICSGKPLIFLLLYNGGYRASLMPDRLDLNFEPDQTELMLLYQIALLKEKIEVFYNFGIQFFIVINNGVAKWVNDIPISETEKYANQLRGMIKFFGAENTVSVLLQSELNDFDPSISVDLSNQHSIISEDEHLIVERFLGRHCSREEAEQRSALYKLAELKWAKDLTNITSGKDGLLMKQVAHSDLLSFRPFPGGAIRIQNGTLGFQFHNNTLVPKLITSKSLLDHNVMFAPYHLSWR